MGLFEGYSLPKDVVMISTADWDEPLWTNKQQIASRLVDDFRVLYVEPLKSIRSGKRGFSKKIIHDPSGVHIFRPAMSLPMGNKFDPINDLNHRRAVRTLVRAIGEMGFEEYILWIYTPNGFPYLKLLSPKLSCYDCVDEYSAFPGAWKGTTMRMERSLTTSVDAVFATARTLFDSKRAHNENTHLVPNVGDYELFSRAQTAAPARAVKELEKPVIGFVGALNYKLDDRLLELLFTEYPDWNFAFVGPDRGFGIEKHIHRTNVHFLGLKSNAKLPEYIAGFDVCIIPYKVDNYTQGVMPIKFYEYLATGKPVVATPIPELIPFSNLVDIAAQAEDFGLAIERRLKKDPADQREKRIALAKENSWEKRIRTILEVLEASYRKKRLSK